MGPTTNLLIGVAGSAMFYVCQKSLDLLPTLWGAFAAAIFGIFCFAAAAHPNRVKSSNSNNNISIMSDINADKSLNANIDGLETDKIPDRTMTNIKSKGNVVLEIKNTSLNEKRN